MRRFNVVSAFSFAIITLGVSNQAFIRPSPQLYKYGTPGRTLSMGLFDDITFPTLKPSSSSSLSSSSPQLPPDFTPPEPKPLTLTRPSDLPSLIRSTTAFTIRLGTGAFVLGWKIDTPFASPDSGKYSLPLGPFFRIRDSSSVLTNAPRPQTPLILYEYDASPYCKRVREMMNILDLTFECRPCPGAREGAFSEELSRRTNGRRTVPYLIDPNTGTEMFESDDQIDYLLRTYGPTDESSYDKKALWTITFQPFSITTSTIAALIRNLPASSRQSNAKSNNEQMKPLELWGYESSPFVRPVREKLCELCLPHLFVSCARGSRNRDELVKRTGGNVQFQVPFLVDPNTGIEMFEGAEIVDYLEAVYTD